MYTYVTCVVNSCQGKVAGLNYSIQRNAVALDVIQIHMVGAIFSPAIVNTVHCMFNRSLSLTVSR